MQNLHQPDTAPLPNVGLFPGSLPWMLVVHFTDTYLPRRDGVITSIRTLVDALGQAGHATLTVVPRHPGQPDDQSLLRLRAVPLGLAGLRVSPWPLRDSMCHRTLAEIADAGPDVIHVHTPGPVGLLGMVAARRLGLPLVQTYHTDLHAYADAYRFPAAAVRAGLRLYARRLDAPRPPMRSEVSRVLSRRPGRRRDAMDDANALLLGDCDAVVVPTRAVLDRIQLPVAPDRLFVVPTGVGARPTTAKAMAALRAQCGLASQDQVVLFVGRINREKGIDLLVSAFARIAAVRPRARLLLVGARYESRWFAGLMRSVGPAVAERVIWAGEQPAEVVAAAYGLAEVFAFPSRTDTQALVLQEAAHAGLPVVLADPVLHRHGALPGVGLCAGEDPDAFAAAVLRVLDERGVARSLGDEAAARAAQHTPAQYAASMLGVYERAMANRPAGATTAMRPFVPVV
jgi:glycosyltransferase involved in cell wall biosynthesis